MKKPVAQKEPAGCGVACVASICGISYEKTKKLFRESAWGYLCRDLVKALAKCGKKYTYKHYLSGEIPTNSIVFIKKSKKYPNGHYLVKTPLGWMDPWMNYPKLFPKAGVRKKPPGRISYVVYPL